LPEVGKRGKQAKPDPAEAKLTPAEKALQDELKALKSTILRQDDELAMMKDIVRSTALQNRTKESELKRMKKRSTHAES
jgi:hypothetical protein